MTNWLLTQPSPHEPTRVPAFTSCFKWDHDVASLEDHHNSENTNQTPASEAQRPSTARRQAGLRVSTTTSRSPR